MKALVGAFNQEKALVGAFSVIVQPVVEPMDPFTALHRFRELIASHYSSATGHATINHHGLMDDLDDDDESPIIRGFNDKEPLVT